MSLAVHSCSLDKCNESGEAKYIQGLVFTFALSDVHENVLACVAPARPEEHVTADFQEWQDPLI